MTKTEEFYFTFHWYEKIHSLFYLKFASYVLMKDKSKSTTYNRKEIT